MAANNHSVVIEGIENIIERDLANHKQLLERTKAELDAFLTAMAHEIEKKRHYAKLVGTGKYNDDSLKASMADININIRHMSDKVELARQKADHHALIVATLTIQLADQRRGLAELAEHRRRNGPEH